MLKKRGNIWWCDFYVGKRRVRESLKTSKHLVAVRRLNYLKAKYKKELLNVSPTLDGFVKKYLDYAWVEKPISARREEQRLKKIQEFFKSEYKLTQLDEVTPYHIEQLKAHLKGKDLAKSTVNRYLQLVRGMFYKAIAWGMYEGKNPVKGIRFYKERSPVEPLTDDQVKQILESAEKISRFPRSPLQRDFYDLCVIAVNTGMRKSEILNMKWGDVKDDSIRIVGKGDRERRLPLNKTVMEAINSKSRRYEYVFDTPNRESKDTFRRSVDKVREDTGIDWRFHQLRHYFATKLLERGVDIVTISRLLGHSKITTSLIYSHTDTGRMRDAVNILNEDE